MKLPLALAAALLAAAPVSILLREQAWIAGPPDAAQILTHSPGECLTRSDAQIEAGRALFRSPALFGGPAARAGLSCNACHTNGRINAHFLLPELTDRPGAADVTSEWASKVRGDGVFNPRDIPDLAGVAARESFGQGREPSLARFVAGVVEEEFQGEPLPGEAFDALMAYLGALEPGACNAETPITLASAADDVRRAFAAARTAEPATARLLIYATRDAVGRIVERLPPLKFATERRALEALSRDLAPMQGDTALLRETAPAWNARFDALILTLTPREAETFFNEPTLARALGDQG